jgi:hypothetical protein
VDRHHGVRAIVLAAEDALRLRGLDPLLEPVEPRGEVGGDVFPGGGPLGQHSQVGFLLPDRFGEVDVVLEPAPALQDLLGFGLVLPEVGLADQRLEAVGLVTRAFGLKDTSAAPRIASRGRRAGGRDLPLRMPLPCLLSAVIACLRF